MRSALTHPGCWFGAPSALSPSPPLPPQTGDPEEARAFLPPLPHIRERRAGAESVPGTPFWARGTVATRVFAGRWGRGGAAPGKRGRCFPETHA